MVSEAFNRVELLLGKKALNRLQKTHIVVAGLGGVGSVAVETLVRTGVGHLTLVDYDISSESNINRQLFALQSTIGQMKTKTAKERMKDIESGVKIDIINEKITRETVENIIMMKPDMIIDCIDDIPMKVELIKAAKARKIKIVSSMGAALRIHPTEVRIAKLKKTKACPLAAKMREYLPNDDTVVVYSEERPFKASSRNLFGSVMPVTATFGLYIAYAAMHTLAGAEIEGKVEEFKSQNLW